MEEKPENLLNQKLSEKKKVTIILGVVIGCFLVSSIATINLLNKAANTQNAVSDVNKNLPQVNKESENIAVERAQQVINNTDKKISNMNLPTVPKKTIENSKNVSIYNNSNLGISFEYPLEWSEITQFETKQTVAGVTNVVMVGTTPDTKEIDNMRITIEDTPVSITSKEYIKQTEDKMKETFPKFQSINTGEITVSGRQAPSRMYLWVPQEELDKSPYEQEWTKMQQYQIYVAGKSKIYIITFTSTNKEFSKDYSKYQKIISTLKLGD